MATLVFSDVHIGDPRLSEQRTKQIIDLIRSRHWSQIILNGDIVDLWVNDDVDFIVYHPIFIELVSCVSVGTQIDWVVGNHDHGIEKLVENYVPFFYFHRSLQDHGMLFMHGHQLDLGKDEWWYAKLATKWNLWWWKKFKFDIQMWWHTTKLYTGECHSDREKILKVKYDEPVIVMGHTHRVAHQFAIKKSVVAQEIFDIGSIMELGTYGVIEDGKISIHRV